MWLGCPFGPFNRPTSALQLILSLSIHLGINLNLSSSESDFQVLQGGNSFNCSETAI